MRFSVGSRIGLGYALALLALLIIGTISYGNITRLNESTTLVSRSHGIKSSLEGVLTQVNNALAIQRGYLLTGQGKFLDDYYRLVGRDDRRGAIQDSLDELQTQLADQPAQSSRVSALRSAIAEKVEDWNGQVTSRQQGGLVAAQRLVIDNRQNRIQKIQAIVDDIQKEEDQLLAGRLQDQDQRTSLTQRTILWGVPAAIVLVAIVNYLLSLSIARPLREMAAAALRISSGDLNVQVPGKGRNDEVGELGQAFNGMVGNLRTALGNIGGASSTLGTAARQLASSSVEMAASASQTSSAVVETTATVGEVRQTAQVASQEARLVAERAQHAAQSAESGRDATEAAVEGMQRIREQMDSIATSMSRLSEQTQAIGDIITSVDDLTQQSNLLAVNAAIEAAKAGERGKGFAVVAQEVKILAEQSRAATSQVRSILGEIQKATSAAVMATEQGTKVVESGTQQFAGAGTSIRTLADNAVNAAQSAQQIALSCQEQLVGMEQIAQAMESIKQASGQNVESARQLEESAQELTSLGGRMQQQVERYNISSNGGPPRGGTHAHPSHSEFPLN